MRDEEWVFAYILQGWICLQSVSGGTETDSPIDALRHAARRARGQSSRGITLDKPSQTSGEHEVGGPCLPYPAHPNPNIIAGARAEQQSSSACYLRAEEERCSILSPVCRTQIKTDYELTHKSCPLAHGEG